MAQATSLSLGSDASQFFSASSVMMVRRPTFKDKTALFDLIV
jgi:hypothetical protein